ncbi:MAG TPA: DUF4136 domain-containing protein [Polyangiaceae bacterium]|nr:DUF4136 domain-containing protein [Polyangiaceae bacterium]
MRRVWLTLSAVVVLLVTGCGAPPPTEELFNDPVVITRYAPNVDFGSFHTFYLRPEIRTLKDDGSVELVDPEKAQPLLDATQLNLVARGYQAVEKADAELGVELDYLALVSTSTWCYSWWDSGYWGYPGWGYYPYYGGCGTDVWRSDLLATHIVDLTQAQANPDGGEGGEGGTAPTDLPGIWFSGVYGVELNLRDGQDGINQAFAQSPYLTSASSTGTK